MDVTLQKELTPNIPSLSSDDKIIGSFFKNGHYSWQATHNQIFIYKYPQAQRYFSLNFEDEQAVEEYTILTAVDAKLNNQIFLVISLQIRNKGELRVVDLKTQRTVRTIDLPYPATTLCCLQNQKKFSLPVAIGTKGGHILLLELNYPALNDAEAFGSRCRIHIVPLSSYNEEEDLSLHQAKHPCLKLNGEFHDTGGVFQYPYSDFGDTRKRTQQIAEKGVVITAMSYIEPLNALAVGFNFGSFQLWSLYNHSLSHSSPLNEEIMGESTNKKSVSFIGYQQLEEDHLGYLWIGRQAIKGQTQRYDDTATVYQMKFRIEAEKTIEQLSSVSKPLLIHAPSDSPSGSWRLAKLHVFPDVKDMKHQSHNDMDSDHNMMMDHNNQMSEGYSRCLFVWAAPGSLRVELFDLKSIVEVLPTPGRPTSPLFFPATVTMTTSTFFLDAWVDESSVEDFTKLERFHLDEKEHSPYVDEEGVARRIPLSFHASFLFNGLFFQCRLLGAQQRALNSLRNASIPFSSSSCHKIHQELSSVGLIEYDGHDDTTRHQFERVLDTAFENNLSSYICDYIARVGRSHDSRNGEANTTTTSTTTTTNSKDEEVVSNPKILLDWAWTTFVRLRHLLVDHCTHVFRQHHELEKEAKILDGVFVRLADLYSIFQTLYSKVDATQEGRTNLQRKIEEIQLAAQHLEVVLWFVQNWTRFGNGSMNFSLNFLQEVYQQRRKGRLAMAKQQSSQQDVMEEEELEDSKKTPVLLLDHLVQATSASLGSPQTTLWRQFPPTDLRMLLGTLSEGHPTAVLKKLSMIYYFLRDMHLADPSMVDHFAQSFMIPEPTQRFISALQLLDSCQSLSLSNVERAPIISSAVGYLSDPTLDSEPAFMSGSHTPQLLMEVLKVQTDLGAARSALQFYRVHNIPITSVSEAQLILQLMLKEGSLQEALEFQRSFTRTNIANGYNQDFLENLLFPLFSFIFTHKKVTTLFQLPLNPEEEDCLMRFMRQDADQDYQSPYADFILIYLLQRNRYEQAFQLFTKAQQHLPLSSQSSVHQFQILSSIMENYNMILPASKRVSIHESSATVSSIFDSSKQQQQQRSTTTSIGTPQQHSQLLSSNNRELVIAASPLIQKQQRKNVNRTPNNNNNNSSIIVSTPTVEESTIMRDVAVSPSPVSSPTLMNIVTTTSPPVRDRSDYGKDVVTPHLMGDKQPLENKRNLQPIIRPLDMDTPSKNKSVRFFDSPASNNNNKTPSRFIVPPSPIVTANNSNNIKGGSMMTPTPIKRRKSERLASTPATGPQTPTPSMLLFNVPAVPSSLLSLSSPMISSSTPTARRDKEKDKLMTPRSHGMQLRNTKLF